MTDINLSEIFKEAFGYVVPNRKIDIEQAPNRLEQSNTGISYYDTDLFGREFFMPVKLNGVLISFAVIGCSWKKKIVNTPLRQRPGTVKELISVEDYAINIKGILINPGNEWVEAGVVEIFNLFKKNQSLTIRSVLTDIFLSGKTNDTYDSNKSGSPPSDPHGYRVMITDINWPAISGIEHAKPFEINVVSDMAYDLVKIKK